MSSISSTNPLPFAAVTINAAWASALPLHPAMYPRDRTTAVFYWLLNLPLRARFLNFLAIEKYTILFELLQIYILQDLHRQHLVTISFSFHSSNPIVLHQLDLQNAIVYGLLELLVANHIKSFMDKEHPNDFFVNDWTAQAGSRLVSLPTFMPVTIAQDSDSSKCLDVHMTYIDDLMHEIFDDTDSEMSDCPECSVSSQSANSIPDLVSIEGSNTSSPGYRSPSYSPFCQMEDCHTHSSINHPSYRVYLLNPYPTSDQDVHYHLDICWPCFQWNDTFNGYQVDDSLPNKGHDSIPYHAVRSSPIQPTPTRPNSPTPPSPISEILAESLASFPSTANLSDELGGWEALPEWPPLDWATVITSNEWNYYIPHTEEVMIRA